MKPFARKSVKSVRNHFPSSPGPCGRLMYPYICPEHISSLKITLKTGFDKLTAGEDFIAQGRAKKENFRLRTPDTRPQLFMIDDLGCVRRVNG
jgi:hypothetical protein